MYLIPHNSQPLQSQNFTHYGHSLTLITRWNTFVGFWNIDVYDNKKQEWLTRGEGLSIGSACLSNIDIPFVLVMLADDPYIEITREALGDTLNVFIIDKEEYADAVWPRV